MSKNCIFCRISSKEAQASTVYEDEKVMAFLSHRPVNVGHTLVIPKKHYENIYSIPEDEAAYLFRIVRRVTHAVRDAVCPEGMRIVQNNGAIGGQVVFHLHVHIIPMKPHNVTHDSIYRDHTHERSPQDLEADAQKIKLQMEK